MQSSAAPGRVGICGFYGQGNIGDEAILEGLLSWLMQNGHTSIALHCARNPDEARLIELQYIHKYPGIVGRTFDDLEEAARNSEFIFGGGTLGAGFGWGMLPKLANSNTRLFSFGMTFSRGWGESSDEFKKEFPVRASRRDSFLKSAIHLFDFISVRDCESLSLLSRDYGMISRLSMSGDLSFLLEPKPSRSDGSISIWVRETEDEKLAHLRRRALREVIVELSAVAPSCRIEIRSCCDKDLVFARWCLSNMPNYSWLVVRPAEISPESALQSVAENNMVISIGRLHPLLFAANAGVPAVGVPSGLRDEVTMRKDKIVSCCSSFDVVHVPKVGLETNDEYCKWLSNKVHQIAIESSGPNPSIHGDGDLARIRKAISEGLEYAFTKCSVR